MDIEEKENMTENKIRTNDCQDESDNEETRDGFYDVMNVFLPTMFGALIQLT